MGILGDNKLFLTNDWNDHVLLKRSDYKVNLVGRLGLKHLGTRYNSWFSLQQITNVVKTVITSWTASSFILVMTSIDGWSQWLDPEHQTCRMFSYSKSQAVCRPWSPDRCVDNCNIWSQWLIHNYKGVESSVLASHKQHPDADTD